MSDLVDICRDFQKKYSVINLDLGCGLYCSPEHVGIDNYLATSLQSGNNPPHYIHDLNKHLPLPDNFVDRIHTSHFLEHSNLDFMLTEAARVLKPGGTFVNRIPYAASAEGHYPGHNIFLTEKWFYESPLFNRYFIIDKVTYVPSDEYAALSDEMKERFPFDFARIFLWQSCKEFTIYTRKKS